MDAAGDKALTDPAALCGAVVEVTLTDGRKVEYFTKHLLGTKEIGEHGNSGGEDVGH